ncbi:enolase-phosphatase E1-like [Vanessa tameamea]|uniref:Enolase-phosphatase E1-like n=1 Tax=Vanessa tameamea TaxID=334116 RepID=A0ABM4ANA3_VANTA
MPRTAPGTSLISRVDCASGFVAKGARWLKPATKRGRGRPPTHGRYVGIGKSQAELREAKSKTKTDRFQTEDALAAYNEAAKLALEERAARSRNRQAETNTEDAPKTALKTAADTIKGAVAELRALTMSEEVARLEAANAQLSGQLAELRREVTEMRRKPQEANEEGLKRIMEEALRCSREQFSNMLNARMEGIERRLLPEPRLRPPLAADRKAAQTIATDRVTIQPESPAVKTVEKVGSTKVAQPKTKKTKRPSMAAQEAAAAAAKKPAPPPASRPGSSGTSWAAVVRQQPSKPPKKPKAATGLATATRKGKKEKRPGRKLRSPRTAIHRPTKCVEVRVVDLDDSVTAEEVVAAVATEGGCSEGAIRPGVVVAVAQLSSRGGQENPRNRQSQSGVDLGAGAFARAEAAPLL